VWVVGYTDHPVSKNKTKAKTKNQSRDQQHQNHFEMIKMQIITLLEWLK
jgi:hypothetical protein